MKEYSYESKVFIYLSWFGVPDLLFPRQVIEYLGNYIQDKEVRDIIEDKSFESMSDIAQLLYIIFYLETVDDDGQIYPIYADMVQWLSTVGHLDPHEIKEKVNEITNAGLFFEDFEEDDFIVVTNKRLYHALKNKGEK